MDTTTVEFDPAAELSDFDGDPRLGRRAVSVTEILQRAPDRPFPRAVSDAELEGLYRFFKNENVTFDRVLEPHANQTAKRCAEAGEVVVIHDTTTFVFNGDREGLGFINKRNRGFLSHISIAVSAADDALPLGTLAAHNWVRQKSRQEKGVPQNKLRHSEDCESHRWLEGIEKTAAMLDPAAAIHVTDREGDIYDVLATLVDASRRFVIRAQSNRGITHDDRELARVFDNLDGLPLRYRKTISVAPRNGASMPDQRAAYPAREGRAAEVAVAATTVEVKRSRHCPPGLPATTSLNVIHVFEPNCPEDEQPVEWVLLTSEPISTDDEIERAIGYYRKRWLIEEFFKAVKTGCAYSKRLLGSYHSLLNALAVTLPVAWGMLLFRAQSRSDDTIPASRYVSKARLVILRSHKRTKHMLGPSPTLREVAYAIARLGGHLKRNGPPGWQILQRGLDDLDLLEAGFLMLNEPAERVSLRSHRAR